MLDQKAILGEMQSLERQRAEQLATLNRIDGAIEMCRHLLRKSAAGESQASGEENASSEKPASE